MGSLSVPFTSKDVLNISKMKRLPLTKDQVQKLKTEFMALDADGDGTITVNELENVLRSMRGKLKASDADIKRAIKEIDKDGDGTIDLEEYLKSRKNKTNMDLIHRALVQGSEKSSRGLTQIRVDILQRKNSWHLFKQEQQS